MLLSDNIGDEPEDEVGVFTEISYFSTVHLSINKLIPYQFLLLIITFVFIS